jgi:hypothetical protein
MLLPWRKNANQRHWVGAKSHSSRLRIRPQLECLEDRFLLANNIFTVTAITDNGTGQAGTLSAAINGVNGSAVGDTNTIIFNLGNNPTILMNGNPLPAITMPVTIDGWSQNNGAPGVAVNINGNRIFGDGLTLNVWSCTVRGLAINNFFGNGLVINNPVGAGNNIYGCNFGTDALGTAAGVGNAGDGILITGPGNLISGNIISGNSTNGIEINGSNANGDYIEGNDIGVNATGTIALANNRDGVLVTNNAATNYIGDQWSGLGNVISGNRQNGVDLVSVGNNQVVDNVIGLGSDSTTVTANGQNGVQLLTAGASNLIGIGNQGNFISGNTLNGVLLNGGVNLNANRVLGNLIGIDVTGTAKPNQQDGVKLSAPSNFIGGVNPGEANTISGNGRNGITITGAQATGNVVSVNFIGTNAAGTGAVANTNDGVYVATNNNTIGAFGATDVNGKRLPTIISGNNNAGIEIAGVSGIAIVNCNIGTNQKGALPIANAQYGVLLDLQASNDTIGGVGGSATLNVISGNGTSTLGNEDNGVTIIQGSSSNYIWGNYIGVASDGITALGNGNNGVYIDGTCNGNMIGTPGILSAFAANVICANGTEVRAQNPLMTGYGVELDAGSNNNLVFSNFIGVLNDGMLTVLANKGTWISDNGNNTVVFNNHN